MQKREDDVGDRVPVVPTQHWQLSRVPLGWKRAVDGAWVQVEVGLSQSLQALHPEKIQAVGKSTRVCG